MKNASLILLIIGVCSTIFPGIQVAALADAGSEINTESEQHFEKANEFQKLSNYDAAITEYEAVISLSPKSAIAQNARYWIGQIYFETRRFDDALSAFQELIDEFPSSVVVPTTRLMIERVQQAKKNRALFEAARKADVEQVNLLIAQGADVDAKWREVYNKNEAEDTSKWRMERTPLWHAVEAGKIEVVKLLVEAGADASAGHWPPLCQAVVENNTAIAEYLIDHGATINYPGDWGPLQESPFMSNNIEMVKLLIARGADINDGTWPVLHIAINRRRRDIVELLIQRGADVNAKDTYGCTPLQYAAQTGRTEVVQLLLEAGANISLRDDRGQTALHAILVFSRPKYRGPKYRLSKETLILLLNNGAGVNLKDKNGRSPLHLAVESADRDIVELLLDKGADVNEKDDASGFTALHHAAQLSRNNIAELLIARGADVNAKDKQGHTPLYVAVNHDYKVTELLINEGADSSIRTESGRTLLELAQQRKQTESTVPDVIFDGDPNSGFSTRIACSDVDGDGYGDILIGAYQYNSYQGRVYLFYGGPDMDTTADLILEGQNKGDWFGSAIVCGDIDNDGSEDIVIGAGQYSEKRGRAYLYWGSDRNSMDANPDKVFTGEVEKGSQFGGGHPAVYDIDNDGYDDIIVGACASGDWTGRAYLYYGNTKELMDTSADLIFTGENQVDQFFGYTISCGDVNNDGFGDVVIGGSARQGRALLYYGANKSNMDAKADVIFKAQSEGNDRFGCGIVCVDQNRDGYDDVVIGAPGYNDWQGRAYLFQGNSKRNLDTNPDMTFDGEVEGSYYLCPVQVVCGDIDGDNVNDIIIGARLFGRQIGRAYVYWGNELTGRDPKPGRIFTGEHPSDEFGYELACGDVNNDGFDDLVVGALKAGANQGRAYLYYGGPRNK
ncbi:MAG: ankyrin repeat domain-containing protein [Planctomycetota bacterium]|jgi:cytohesin